MFESAGKKFLLAVFLLLAMPAIAQANTGTVFMWATFLHLLVGNLLLGIMEGCFLAKVFKVPKGKSIGLFILANYYSAWLGACILPTISNDFPLTLTNAWIFLWFMVFVAYILTLILELPFAIFIFIGHVSWFRKAVHATLLVQTVSYVLLFGWYFMASGTSLYTKTDIVPVSSMHLPKDVVVYFTSAEDGQVYSGALDKRVWQGSSYPDLHDEEGTRLGKVPQLGSAEASSWEFFVNFWAEMGLRGTNKKSGKRVRIALKTPFVSWYISEAVHLPGDKVLFQLSHNQICLYDPEEQEIALLALGNSPVALIQDNSTF
jgi:hypothetical protein